jgi:hypothetical protein
LDGGGGGRSHRNCHGGFCNPRRAMVKLFLKVLRVKIPRQDAI